MRELGTVVVADSSAVARQLFGLCFSRIAREVRPATNAEEALRSLETATAPALLVADAQLPPISALALYAQCGRLAVRPELIVTTCHHDAREADRAWRKWR